MSRFIGTRTRRWFAIGSMVLAAAACGRPAEQAGTPGSSTGVIRIDGSSTVFPITEAIAEEFQRAHGSACCTVGTSGTGGGFQKFCRGETDISNASRPIQQVEADRCADSRITFVELPIAFDGVTVVVNPRNTWATSMTVAELKRLWEPAAEGKVTRWSQLRPEWPDREIHLFGAGVDSGTFDYFTETIVGKQDASRGDYTASEDDNMLVQGVAGDENALGFFGFAYYHENRAKLKAVAIDDGDDMNGKGPVAPSLETVRDGRYTPLSRPVFIYVRTQSLDRPDVKRFVDFYMASAGKLANEVGFVPLSDREYQLIAKRAEARTPGSLFKSSRLPPGTTLESLLSGAS
jgi:phosphate transport system substrate-binding protein